MQFILSRGSRGLASGLLVLSLSFKFLVYIFLFEPYSLDAMSKKPIVRAKQWQLDILKKMHAEEARPSTSQRHKLVIETGL